MAIAYSTAGSGQLGNNNQSANLAADVGSGTDRILWVTLVVSDGGATDNTTALTYNGTALTKLVGRELTTTDQFISLWYLVNPTSGSNNITWTASVNSYSYAAWSVYTGAPVATTVIGTNTDSADDASAPMTLTLTTQGDNAWLVSGVRSTDYGDHAASTGTTERAQFAGSIGDSNGAQSPAGAYSMSWDSIPTAGKIGGVMGHFYVSTASGPANLKSYNTNLKANIKSINTNLIANIKSLNTNV